MFSYQNFILSSGLALSLAGCNLTVSVNEGGIVQSNPQGINCRINGEQCEAEFSNSTTVELTATADEGYTFTGWEGDIESFCNNNTCSLPMGKNRNVSASFSQLTISEGIPDSITWGETIYFSPFSDSSALDYQVTIKSNLVGMQSHSKGVIKWTPSHPLFAETNTASLSFVRTTEVGEETVSKTVVINGTKSNYPKIVNGFSVPTKDNHTVIADIDNDGKTELLIAGANRYLYSMEYSSGTYIKDWTLAHALGNQSYISAITAADINGDDYFEIFIAYRNQLVVLDGLTKNEIGSTTVESEEIKEIALADLSGDGSLDLIISHGEKYWDAFYLEILNPATLEGQWISERFEFKDFAIGQLDQDAALEIAATSGAVFDGVTLEIEWQHPEIFGNRLTVADLDGNNIDELIAANGWVSPVVYNVILQSPIAELPVENSGICSLGTERGTESDTVLVGDCQWGEISAWNLDGITPVMLWEIDSIEHGSVGVRAADTNNDGDIDYIWSSGISSSGPNDLIIASKTPDIAVQWQARNDGGLASLQYSAQKIANTESGPRAIFGGTTHNARQSAMNLVSVDLHTGQHTVSEALTTRGNLTGISIADYDNDGIDETFVSGSLTGSYYDGNFAMYSTSSLASLWISPEGDDDDWSFTHASDVNNDGFLEVIGRGDGKIQIWDVKNNSSLWTSVTVAGFKSFAMSELSNGEQALFAMGSDILWHYGPHEDYFVVKNSYSLDNLQSVFTYQHSGQTYVALVARAAIYAPNDKITILNESLEVVHEISVEAGVFDIYQPLDSNSPLWVLSSKYRTSTDEVFSKVTAYDSSFTEKLWESKKLVGNVNVGSKITWDAASKKAVFASSAGAIISN